jgi:hypothetical protein
MTHLADCTMLYGGLLMSQKKVRMVHTVKHAVLLSRGLMDRKKAHTYVRTVLSVRFLFLREESS